MPLTVKRYSDTLLIFLLKANRPDKFRENLKVSGDVEHKHSGQIAVGAATPPHVLEVLDELARRRAADAERSAEGGRTSSAVPRESRSVEADLQ